MPMRQETFTIVPTTLVHKISPRRPMTSKAAKKAYRESTRLPKVSKAEQRRLEREELARQKREHEKERAAAKAKAVREKKQLKEKEERERRKKEGLPEPNRFVRASQPTIKRFVTSGLGGKRSWEEVENEDNDENAGALVKAHRTPGILEKCEERTVADIPSKIFETEDYLGEFSSPPLDNLPPALETVKGTLKSAITSNPPPLDTSMPSPKRVRRTYQEQQTKKGGQENQEQMYPERAKVHDSVAEVALKAQSSISTRHLRSVKNLKSQAARFNSAGTSAGRQTYPPMSSPVITGPQSAKKPVSSVYSRSHGLPREDLPKAMLSPPLPLSYKSVANNPPRKPLSDLSNNVVLSALRKRPKTASHTNRVQLQHRSTSPPSTQAFLEAHLDDFFPSLSQQIRELMDDIVDVPSNTQVAREIDASSSPKMTQLQLPQLQTPVEAMDLSFFSSQDFVISSQDLREMDSPSRALPLDSMSDRQYINPPSQAVCLASSRKPSLSTSDVIEASVITDSQHMPRPRKQPKPRFFEEKEEDLYHAALHESLVMAKEKSLASSPKRSQRTLQRVKSIKTDDGNDEFGLNDFDLDSESLAALDGVEMSSFDNNSTTCMIRV